MPQGTGAVRMCDIGITPKVGMCTHDKSLGCVWLAN